MATLAGILDVTLGTAADPILGESYDLLTVGSEAGTFSAINLPPLDPGLGWNTQSLYTNGTISVVGVVQEPVSGVVVLGFGLMLGRRRRAALK